MQFKEATTDHIRQMHRVRTTVHQIVLSNPARITPQDYQTYIGEKGKGWVCEVEGTVVGFAIISLVDNNVWALFVLPDWEGKGIGKQLQQLMLDWYFNQTTQTVWLSTDQGTRAADFYLKTGWKRCGWYNDTELKFEMQLQDWQRTQL